MRVAIVGPFPPAPGLITGGVEAAGWYLANELASRPAFEVSVLVTNRAEPHDSHTRWGSMEVVSIGRRPWLGRGPDVLYGWGIQRRDVHRLLSRIEPDVVHFEGASLLAVGCPWPSVLTMHGIVELDALWSGRFPLNLLRHLQLRIAETLARRRIPHIILSSPYVEEHLPPATAGQRRWILDNAIDGAFFAVERAPDPDRILVCGRVNRRKNTLAAIEAMADIHRRHPRARLRLAGREDRHYGGQCRRRVAELGLGSVVEFLGNLSLEETRDELARASCMLLPSRQETAPLSIGEAMAAGVPVVASAICGIPYLVADGETGFLVDGRAPAEIAGALDRILGDPEGAQRLGAAGRAVAERRFRAPDLTDRTVEIYREILGRS